MTAANPERIKVVGEVLDDKQESAVATSATKLWKLVSGSKCGAEPIAAADEPRVTGTKTTAAIALEVGADGRTTTTTFGEAIWPVARDALDTIGTPSLRLLPLSRLGAAEGLSGNRVLIGYFTAPVVVSGKIMPSRPMVVKISKQPENNKIAEEYNCAVAVRKYALYNPGEFALPLFFDTVDGFGILWSPFSSSLPVLQSHEHSPSRLNLAIEDFSIHLRAQAGTPSGSNPGKINPVETIHAVYDLLKPLHSRGGMATPTRCSLVEEYKWYLRDFEEWRHELCSIWGSKEHRDIEVDGRTRVNPLWVFERIQELRPVKLMVGAVQGDMHPRNVVFSERRSPHIIDFGWARDHSHAIKDFVLMECNLRFMVLQPLLSKDKIEAFARSITRAELTHLTPVLAGDEYCTKRVEMLCALRERATDYVHDPDNDRRWHEQYTIPLFLVALGLLKLLRQADCQTAALATVLALAERIASDVLKS